MKSRIAALFLGLCMMFFAADVQASQTGWSPQVIAFGAQRQHIKSTHILARPNRPGHFYGNTVRRRYYHGSSRMRLFGR